MYYQSVTKVINTFNDTTPTLSTRYSYHRPERDYKK